MRSLAVALALSACGVDTSASFQDAYDHNAECCELWLQFNTGYCREPGADPEECDGLAFFNACGPGTPSTCITYVCPAAPIPVEVCTGSPP